MQLYQELAKSILIHSERNAFCINGLFYTYNELSKTISSIRKLVSGLISKSDKIVGLVANDDLETYASIIALWFEGKAYVPVSPEAPENRNMDILDQIGISTIIDSSQKNILTNYKIIKSNNLQDCEINHKLYQVDDLDLSFILFTSGSTGVPKGVPITCSNISALIDSFFKLKFEFDENDKFLQMFELTFDASIIIFLSALLKGACIYTVPKNTLKLSYVHELIDEQKLTVTIIQPSFLYYLRPYFNEICFSSIKYCLLGGEALPISLTKEWSQCLPNATILNVYGPTEFTIQCTHYQYNRNGDNKSSNGIMSIGKPMDGCKIIVVDQNNKILENGKKGELCLSGPQLTMGYCNNDAKNNEVFFFIQYKGVLTRFYKTGDLAIIDDDGDIMYLGRIDFQAKINGYRVELAEVEYHTNSYLNNINVVALSYLNQLGDTELGLVIENEECNINDLIKYLKSKVPFYMIPAKIKLLKDFPLNIHGKIDRKALTKLFV